MPAVGLTRPSAGMCGTPGLVLTPASLTCVLTPPYRYLPTPCQASDCSLALKSPSHRQWAPSQAGDPHDKQFLLQHRVDLLTQVTQEHEQYQEAVTEFQLWLKAVVEKVRSCLGRNCKLAMELRLSALQVDHCDPTRTLSQLGRLETLQAASGDISFHIRHRHPQPTAQTPGERVQGSSTKHLVWWLTEGTRGPIRFQ